MGDSISSGLMNASSPLASPSRVGSSIPDIDYLPPIPQGLEQGQQGAASIDSEEFANKFADDVGNNVSIEDKLNADKRMSELDATDAYLNSELGIDDGIDFAPDIPESQRFGDANDLEDIADNKKFGYAIFANANWEDGVLGYLQKESGLGFVQEGGRFESMANDEISRDFDETTNFATKLVVGLIPGFISDAPLELIPYIGIAAIGNRFLKAAKAAKTATASARFVDAYSSTLKLSKIATGQWGEGIGKRVIGELTVNGILGLASVAVQSQIGRDVQTDDYTSRMIGDALGGTAFAGLAFTVKKAFGSKFIQSKLVDAGLKKEVAKEVVDDIGNEVNVTQDSGESIKSVDSNGNEIDVKPIESDSLGNNVRYGDGRTDGGIVGVIDNGKGVDGWRSDKVLSAIVDASQVDYKIPLIMVKPDDPSINLNGHYRKGSIVINSLLSTAKKTQVIGHELTHMVLGKMPKDQKDIVISSMVKALDSNAKAKGIAERYNYEGMNDREIAEEFMSDRGGVYFAENLSKILKGANKTKNGRRAIDAFVRSIAEFISKIKQRIIGNSSLDGDKLANFADAEVAKVLDNMFSGKASKALKDLLSDKTGQYRGGDNSLKSLKSADANVGRVNPNIKKTDTSTRTDTTPSDPISKVKSDSKPDIKGASDQNPNDKQIDINDVDSIEKRLYEDEFNAGETELTYDQWLKEGENNLLMSRDPKDSVLNSKSKSKSTINDILADAKDDAQNIVNALSNNKSRLDSDVPSKYSSDNLLSSLYLSSRSEFKDLISRLGKDIDGERSIKSELSEVSRSIPKLIKKVLMPSVVFKKNDALYIDKNIDDGNVEVVLDRYFSGSKVVDGKVVKGIERQTSTIGNRSVGPEHPDFISGGNGITDIDALSNVIAATQDAYLSNKVDADGNSRESLTDEEIAVIKGAVIRSFDEVSVRIYSTSDIVSDGGILSAKSKASGGVLLADLQGASKFASETAQNSMTPEDMLGNVGATDRGPLANAMGQGFRDAADTNDSIVNSIFNSLAASYEKNGLGIEYVANNFRTAGKSIVGGGKKLLGGYKIKTYRTKVGKLTGEELITLRSSLVRAVSMYKAGDKDALNAIHLSGFVTPDARNVDGSKPKFVPGLKYAIRFLDGDKSRKTIRGIDIFEKFMKSTNDSLKDSSADIMSKTYLSKLDDSHGRKRRSIQNASGHDISEIGAVPMMRLGSDRLGLYDSSSFDSYGRERGFYDIFDNSKSIKGKPFVLDPMANIVAKTVTDDTRLATNLGPLRWAYQINDNSMNREMFESLGGSNYTKYMDTLLKDIADPNRSNINTGVHAVFGRWAYNAQTVYALGANVKNAAIQYASVLFFRDTYGTKIFVKNIIKGFTDRKRLFDEVMSNGGGQYQTRLMAATGSSDLMDLSNANPSIDKALKKNAIFGKTITEWSMAMMRWMDSAAVLSNWAMAKDMVARDSPKLSGDDYWIEVNRIAMKEIDRSQPTGSQYTRNPYQRSSNPLIKISFGRFSSATGKIASGNAAGLRDAIVLKEYDRLKAAMSNTVATAGAVAVLDTAYQEAVLAGGDKRDMRKYRKQKDSLVTNYGFNFLVRSLGVNPVTGMAGSLMASMLGKQQYTNVSPGQDFIGALYRASRQAGKDMSGESADDRSSIKAYMNVANAMGFPINNFFKSFYYGPIGLARILSGSSKLERSRKEQKVVDDDNK